jgi:putative phage-type endonuclease
MKPIYLVQGTQEWLDWRFSGVGASDIPAILGISPYEDATRENILREKSLRIVKSANGAMARGSRLEPKARAMYQERRPCGVRVLCGSHDVHPWAIASFDGLCECQDTGEFWALEIKCPNREVHRQALNGVVPEHFQAQIQWQLFVSGLCSADFVSYSDAKEFGRSDALAVVRLERNQERIGELLKVAAEFWMEVVDAREAANDTSH